MEKLVRQKWPRRISRFECPTCGYNAKIKVVNYDTIVQQVIDAVYVHEDKDNVDVYYDRGLEFPYVGYTDYQCERCGWIIPVVNDKELGEWLLEQWKEYYDEQDNG